MAMQLKVFVCEYVRGSDFNLEENECYGSNRRQFRRRVRIIRIQYVPTNNEIGARNKPFDQSELGHSQRGLSLSN